MKRPSRVLSSRVRWLIIGSLFCMFAFLLLMTRLEANKMPLPLATTLEGAISLSSMEESRFGEKLFPGQAVRLRTMVRNIGNAASAPGEIFIRFAFDEPLHDHPESTAFETEKIAIPALSAGQEHEITFATPHRWPTLFDYVQDDWAMRRYQAVFVAEEKEFLIGHLSLSVSAHYYVVPNDKRMAMVPSI